MQRLASLLLTLGLLTIAAPALAQRYKDEYILRKEGKKK